MRNAKEEILREDLSKIIAAEIEYKGWHITYKKGGDLNEFLNKLDFEYDAGYRDWETDRKSVV